MDWHRRAAVPDVVMAAQKTPRRLCHTAGSCAGGGSHTDGEAGWERQPFLSDPWPHLPKLQLPPLWNTPNLMLSQGNPEQQTTDCTEREHTELYRRSQLKHPLSFFLCVFWNKYTSDFYPR